MRRKRLKRAAYIASKPFSLKALIRLTRQSFIFPFYHLVSDAAPAHVKHLFPVTKVGQFKKDLDFLLSNYKPATIENVQNFIKNEKKGKTPQFFLSFDDGFSECFHIIAPILKAKGIPAAFFLNPAFVGNNRLSHRQKISIIIDKVESTDNIKLLKQIALISGIEGVKLDKISTGLKYMSCADELKINKIAALLEIDFQQELTFRKPYMDYKEIQQLHNDGFSIGSHSFDHPEFYGISQEEMQLQVEKSFFFLQSELNIQNKLFSFPFTDHKVPMSFFTYLTKNAEIDLSFGTAGLKNDPVGTHLQRIPMEKDGFSSAEGIIRAEYFYYIGKALVGKNIIKRE